MRSFLTENGRAVAALVMGVLVLYLIMPLGDWLDGKFLPALHWFASLGVSHPEVAEIGVIVSAITPFALTMTVILLLGLRGRLYLTADISTSKRRNELIAYGIRFGVPYGLCGYFLYWWTNTPSNLLYAGVTGHPSAFGLPLLTLLLAYGAVCEEVYFRGFLFVVAKRIMPVLPAAILGVLAFVIWHPQLHSDGPRLLGLVSGGVLYTYLTHRSHSVLPAAIAHACFNTIQILLTNF